MACYVCVSGVCVLLSVCVFLVCVVRVCVCFAGGLSVSAVSCIYYSENVDVEFLRSTPRPMGRAQISL